jgi:hypothetical protein
LSQARTNFEPVPQFDAAGRDVVLVEPLHHHHDRVPLLVVEPGRERGVEIAQRRLAFEVGLRHLGIMRIINY